MFHINLSIKDKPQTISEIENGGIYVNKDSSLELWFVDNKGVIPTEIMGWCSEKCSPELVEYWRDDIMSSWGRNDDLIGDSYVC